MDKYTKVKTIGKGNMGTCTLARNNEDGKYYVIKQVDLTRMSKKDRQQSLNEARVLSSLRHPNIINYVDSFLARKSDNLCIVMEYAESGDVCTSLKKNCGVHVPERQVLDWLIQLVLSLDYVHQRKILHRDVKTQNIFLTNENLIKLGDFGIARTLANTYDQAQTFVGTPYYLSPELILEQPYDHRSDVWALGVVLYEMLTLQHPFSAKDMKGLLQRILAVQYDPLPTMYSTELRDIVAQMLVRDPGGRMKLEDILQLPIVRERIQQWLQGPDGVPQHYVRSLCKHHLLPASIDGATVIPSPRSAARAAAAIAHKEWCGSSEATSAHRNLRVRVLNDAGMRPLVAPRRHYSTPSAAVGACSSSTDNGTPDQVRPFIAPLKPYSNLPQVYLPRLPAVHPRAQSNNKASTPSPQLSSLFTTPNGVRSSALRNSPQQSEPVCQSSPASLPVQRPTARSKAVSRPYARPYAAQPHLLSSAGYLLMANPRRNPSDVRCQQTSKSSGPYLNPLYSTPRQMAPAYRQLTPPLSPPTDIKAMLHRAVADCARRRHEFA
ncbi:protein kinase, putative [Leishmania panamensis]|uniref:non-specific serine/threonine protein kinase n=1 Tax=Leishmania panamensis TaxID=5679 RepID=A0A088RL40_LEIPA|nr:protein kinase, putative [Leishmania panamensis]AIN96717.1 protein kinase, putative [Leishmania panamensis]